MSLNDSAIHQLLVTTPRVVFQSPSPHATSDLLACFVDSISKHLSNLLALEQVGFTNIGDLPKDMGSLCNLGSWRQFSSSFG